jgi:hypothetical protein
MRLVAFPDTQRQVVVDENGREPHFSRDGRELFYVKVVEDSRGQTTESLVSVPVVSADPFKLGPPVGIYTAKAGGPTLDEVGIAPDGRRFLLRLSVPFAAGEGEKLVYLQNWRASLKK